MILYKPMFVKNLNNYSDISQEVATTEMVKSVVRSSASRIGYRDDDSQEDDVSHIEHHAHD